jgi:phenylacetate-CoA ligase
VAHHFAWNVTPRPTTDKTRSAAGRLPSDSCDRDWIWDREVETAPQDQALAIASAAWAVQAEHLAEGSPFYVRKFREAGMGTSKVSLKDIVNLPFTTKDELRQASEAQPPWGTNAGVPAQRIKRVYQTSGTTGSPTAIALTVQDMDSWTTIGSRTYYATGIHEHSGVLTTFGAGPFVAGHTHFVLTNIGARAVPVAPGDTARVLSGLKAGLADTLLATPSFAQYLANRLEQADADARPHSLVHVVTGGEPGGGIPAVRDHIENVLGVTVNEVMGIGDVAPSLFGECPAQQGMHFCGTGHVWPELVDPATRQPMAIEAGATGELVYTHLTREAMPVVRFLSGDIVRIEGTSCECGRTTFRMRCLARRDDMFIVRGVNVYPAAILAVVGEFRPRVTGRARVVRNGNEVSVQPPVPVEVEVPGRGEPDAALAAEIEEAIHTRLTFRCKVELIPEHAFGESGYKTNLTVKRP